MIATLDASRRALYNPFEPDTLQRRRHLCLAPLTKARRMALEAMLVYYQDKLGDKAVVQVYGHPARCMLIAYPQRGYEGRELHYTIGRGYLVFATGV